MLKILQTFIVLSIFCVVVIFAYASYGSIEYETQEQNLTESLQKKVVPGYLDSKIITAIASENFDDVQMYQNLAYMLHQKLHPATEALIAEHNGLTEKSLRNAKAFVLGFLSGKSDSMVGMSGSIASDMTLYGDIRDIKVEGTKYNNGEPYDDFILKLSLVGVGLSASQLVTLGSSTPLKIGASVMKLGRKTGTLSQTFLKTVSKKLTKTVDMKLLKNMEFSLLHLGKTSKTISKSINLTPMKGLFKDVNKVKQYTSLTDTVSLLKYVDTTKDLQKLGKISKTFKGNTKGVMAVLGKSAFKAGKTIVKQTAKLAKRLMGLVTSLIGFFLLLDVKFFLFKRELKRWLWPTKAQIR